MNLALVARSAKNVLSRAETNFNRALGRQFVPVQDDIIAIEATSVCNLECCFCAYTKKETPKITMEKDRFVDYIGQALDMGYRRFILTPNTGDVFMDRHLFTRLQFLEQHPKIKDYTFYTNFTIPRPKDIERLAGLKKFHHPTISVYGHDRDSFVAISKARGNLYDRLLGNLEHLLALRQAGRLGFDFTIALRSTRDVPGTPTTDLLRLLERFRQSGVDVRTSRLYHDWGGQVTKDDIKDLAIDMVDSTKTYKNGSCALLFTGVQIMATGVVHACACVDVDAQLEIGNMNQKPLREIVSPNNPAYMAFIEEQEKGAFMPVCQGCGFYKSIYHNRSVYRKDGIATQSVESFKTRLEGKCSAAASARLLAAE